MYWTWFQPNKKLPSYIQSTTMSVLEPQAIPDSHPQRRFFFVSHILTLESKCPPFQGGFLYATRVMKPTGVWSCVFFEWGQKKISPLLPNPQRSMPVIETREFFCLVSIDWHRPMRIVQIVAHVQDIFTDIYFSLFLFLNFGVVRLQMNRYKLVHCRHRLTNQQRTMPIIRNIFIMDILNIMEGPLFPGSDSAQKLETFWSEPEFESGLVGRGSIYTIRSRIRTQWCSTRRAGALLRVQSRVP
jgi:hypothetical protein